MFAAPPPWPGERASRPFTAIAEYRERPKARPTGRHHSHNGARRRQHCRSLSTKEAWRFSSPPAAMVRVRPRGTQDKQPGRGFGRPAGLARIRCMPAASSRPGPVGTPGRRRRAKPRRGRRRLPTVSGNDHLDKLPRALPTVTATCAVSFIGRQEHFNAACRRSRRNKPAARRRSVARRKPCRGTAARKRTIRKSGIGRMLR